MDRGLRRAGAAFTVGGVAAAGAGVFSRGTGRYPDAESVRLSGPGESLDPAASDYSSIIEERTRDIPFASEEAREIVRDALVADGRRDAPGTSLVTTGEMRGWAAQGAICSWANALAAARRTGDTSSSARALGMLDEASRWRAVTDLDPRQVIKHRRIRVAGTSTSVKVVDQTEFGYLPLVQRAAHKGDAA